MYIKDLVDLNCVKKSSRSAFCISNEFLFIRALNHSCAIICQISNFKRPQIKNVL